MSAPERATPIEGASASATLPEPLRDRLLRRVDWRFLLPSPCPRRSICFTGGDLAAGVALISQHTIGADAAPSGTCDLAVVAEPDRATLRAARAALRPGGTLYVEWRVPLLPLAAARRRLAAAGFEAIAFYAPLSDPARSRPERWVPLEASGARGYDPRNRTPASTHWRRAMRALRSALGLTRLHRRLTAPVCAIAVTPQARPVPAGVPRPRRGSSGRRETSLALAADGLTGLVRARWAEWGWGDPPARIAPVLLTGGRRSINKVVALVFVESERVPRLAIKAARTPEALPGLQREAAALRGLERYEPRVPGVPRVVFCGRVGGVFRLGETVLAGRSIATLLAARNARRLALAATEWQILLAQASQTPPDAGHQSRRIEAVLAEFQRSFGPCVDPGLLRAASDRLRGLRPLPAVCEQRDFAPWNLLVSRTGELAVLDWESSEPRGSPALDLIYLLLHLGIQLDRAHASGRYEESYRATLTPSTPVGAIAEECFALYGRAFGLTAADLHALRLLAWMSHSRSAYRRASADAAGPPAPERLRRTLFVRLWEAEMRHADAR